MDRIPILKVGDCLLVTIQVDMHVSRYQEFPEDGMVQIWGHVGDYEASIWLPLTDQRVQSLLRKRKTEAVPKPEIGAQ